MKIKILVIRFSSIGDIVLTTPIVRCLKNKEDAEVEIHYLTKKQYESILSSNPYISKVYTIEKSTAEVIEELKKEQYDYIVDLHKNIRSSQVKRKLKLVDFTYNKRNVEKWLLVNFGINKLPDNHIVDRYFEAIQPLDVINDNKGLDFFIPKEDEVELSELGINEKYIAITVGAKQVGKKISPKQWIEILEKIELKTVLLGGNEDSKAAKQIEEKLGSKVINLCGKLSLNQSSSVIQQSELVIAHDTGLMHIASAFKKKIISIWCCTRPVLGMYPYQPHPDSVMILPKDVKPQPCSKLGDKCKNKPTCSERISTQEVVNSVNRLLSK